MISSNKIIIFCLFIPIASLAKEAIGWHWYNEVYVADKKPEQEKNKQENSANMQMHLLRETVREAKAKAILEPTEANMRMYLILQNLVIEKASVFARVWKKTLLAYPELDYSVAHPTQNSAQHILYAEVRKKEDRAIKYFSQRYGLLFFYRGNEAMDQTLAPTIESFCKENNISLIPVAVDGKKLAVFNSGQTDTGQATKLGVKYFPALILVDPKNQKTVPLNYGFISESDLRRRFLQVASNFQEGV